VAAEVQRLIAAGIKIDSPPVAQSWLWTESWLRDPAGNRICVYHAGEARRFPPWRKA
jgi:hydroxymethylpyrimidine/phosphomethylpyrimidine kinase